jgi:hypothetical protein
MLANTFEFIDVRDWCRAAANPEDVLSNPRIWVRLFSPTSVRLARPDWLLPGTNQISPLSAISSNLGFAPYSFSGMQKIVHTMRDKIGLPSTFTLDACRHGGMTELEEAELTDGQGRALSAHKTASVYAGYAKRTIERALSATRKRHAHRLANAAGTEFRHETRNRFRNEDSKREDTSIKAMKGR